MLGVNDFIGYYDWTFEFLRRNYGEGIVEKYWEEAIAKDAMSEFYKAVPEKGIIAMVNHWVWSAVGEECDAHICFSTEYFRYDMHSCPSLGFLLKRGKQFYHDYCAHCIGWIKPMLEARGWSVHHEHNHKGQCWFEYHRKEKDCLSKIGELSGKKDVRIRDDWDSGKIHSYHTSKNTNQ